MGQFTDMVRQVVALAESPKDPLAARASNPIDRTLESHSRAWLVLLCDMVDVGEMLADTVISGQVEAATIQAEIIKKTLKVVMT